MQPTPMRLLRFIPLVAITLSIFLVVLTINSLKENKYIGGGVAASNVISVTGEGETFAIPDIATFNFSAQATGKTVTEAQAQVTKIIDSALVEVKKGGVEDKDIQTTDYSANPKYEYINGVCTTGGMCKPSTQNIIGYDVSQTISVKVRKVDTAGTILGAIGGTGVTNVSGLSFTIDDKTKLESDARTKAIADAKTKANELAKELGVSLVRIVSFNESNGGGTVMYAKTDMVTMSAGAAPAPQLPVGQNKISSNVTITYEIR